MLIGLWACSNPECGQPCTSLTLDSSGLCPSCSFLNLLASRPVCLWEDEEPTPPQPEPFPYGELLRDVAVAFALVLLLALLTCLPGLEPLKP